MFLHSGNFSFAIRSNMLIVIFKGQSSKFINFTIIKPFVPVLIDVTLCLTDFEEDFMKFNSSFSNSALVLWEDDEDDSGSVGALVFSLFKLGYSISIASWIKLINSFVDSFSLAASHVAIIAGCPRIYDGNFLRDLFKLWYC